MKIRLARHLLPFRYIFYIGLIAFSFIILLNYLAVNAIGNYYDLGLLLLTFSPLPVFVLLLYSNNEKKLFASFLFLLIFIPSISNYLNVVGGPFLVISIEILALMFLFLSCLSGIKGRIIDNKLYIFIALWLIGNTISVALSQNISNSFPIYLLAIFTVIPWVLILDYQISDPEYLKKVIIPVFCFSLSLFAISAIALVYLEDGLKGLNIISIIRPSIQGPGYLHNNSASGFALLSLPLSFALLRINLRRKNMFHTILYLFLMLSSTFIILLDKSRSAFLTVFLFLFIFSVGQVLQAKKNIKSFEMTPSSFLLLFFMFIFFCFLIYLSLDSFLQRLAGDETDFSPAMIIWNTLISSRGAILLTSWNEFISSPIYGLGYGNGLFYIPEFGTYWNSHNMLLEQLNATGVIGTIPIFYLLITSFLFFLKQRSKIFGPDLMIVNSVFVTIIGLLSYGFLSGMELIGAYDVVSSAPMLILVFLNMILIGLCKSASKKLNQSNV